MLKNYKDTGERFLTGMMLKAMKDFFISRTGADQGWAEWVAWQLEEAGYSVVLQDWDFRPGQNFVLEMNRAAQVAERTIAVLSPDYLAAPFTAPEWAAAFALDPQGTEGRFIVVRVRECTPPGLMRSIIYIDLVDATEKHARKRLIDGVKPGRAKPSTPPPFPQQSPRVVNQRPRFPGALPPVWNVPHFRNPNFTGRKALLRKLRTTLVSGRHAAHIRAIAGLGGVGKSQVALEYAYRHTRDYDVVWWIRAEEPATLAIDYAQLATKLGLLAKDLPQSDHIAAVRAWLGQNGGWLLIFDNADSPEEIRPYMPQGGTGHILVTSRNPNWKEIAFVMPVEIWEREESVKFLCRRTEQTDKVMASDLAKELGDLPLALEQAAAYVEAAGVTLAQYLNLFRHYHLELMKRNRPPAGYKATVTTTWKITFEQVQEASPAGADLLRLCSFLAPDDIPKEFLTNGREWLPKPLRFAVANPLKYNQILADLRRYSLINLNQEVLSLHRLVQAVQRDELTDKQREYWSQITLRFINELIHRGQDDMRVWPKYFRLLPHALEATKHCEEHLEPQHPDMINSFSNLARLYYELGNYQQAESLLHRVLAVKEKLLGPDNPDIATNLNNLALLYTNQGKYEAAEPLYQRALFITETALGPNHRNVGVALNNLALLYDIQGKYVAAGPLYHRALVNSERALGPNHPDIAITLNNLAGLHESQGNYELNELLYQRALLITEKSLGPDHPTVAATLNNLAGLYTSQGKYEDAEPLYQRALAIIEKALGPEHPSVAITLNNLA
ncbi:MAG TPA: FxSxx-COOH system tetratricopeptide repeat protein, partial [Spirochaetia bacterium]|nr:FxSxx-COOH system tetratricopeptide repeat protein [Spirochaetia bacterium]